MEQKEALDMAIKALEQQPCEDCIRRQAVIKHLHNEYHGMISDESMKIYEIINMLKEQPSVTPQPKTGHWIEVTNGRGGHECDLCHEYAPSYKDGDERLTKYCPSCGAKMQEVEE